MVVVLVLDLIDIDFGIVFGGVGEFGECHPIESFGKGENAFAHIVDREICTDLVLVKGVFLASHLFGIVIVVTRSKLEFFARFINVGLHFRDFFGHFVFGRAPDLEKKVAGGFGCLGHYIVGHI